MTSATDAPELEAIERFWGHAYTFSHDPAAHPDEPHAAHRKDGQGTLRAGTLRAGTPDLLLDVIKDDARRRPFTRRVHGMSTPPAAAGPGHATLPARTARTRPGPVTRQTSRILGPVSTAPGCARGTLREALTRWDLAHLTSDAEAIASELAANAVNASVSPDGRPAHLDGRIPVIRVRLLVDKTVLVAEVWDQVGGVPARKIAGDADESGRGLHLVHELTNARWGWYHAPSGPGKCVWAEFPIPGPSRPTANPRGKDSTDERHAKRYGSRPPVADFRPPATSA